MTNKKEVVNLTPVEQDFENWWVQHSCPNQDPTLKRFALNVWVASKNHYVCGSSFTSYDTSQGACGLCGRLTCSGNCFK